MNQRRYVLSLPGERRVALTLLLLPLLLTFIGFAAFPLVAYAYGLVYGGRVIGGGIGFGLGVGIVGALTVLFGAAPAIVWRLRRGPIGRNEVLLWGAALGNMPGLLGAILGMLRANRPAPPLARPPLADATHWTVDALWGIGLGSCIGLIAALVFWTFTGRYIGADASFTTADSGPASRA